MAQNVPPHALIEGCRLIFRNFVGREGRYNQEGTRTFGVVLTDDVAEVMSQQGWNIKVLEPREEDEDQTPTPWIPVEIRFDIRPPKVSLLTDRGLTEIGEQEIGRLDDAEITNVDVYLRPWRWENGDKTGIKAFVQTMVVAIEEDPLTKKYAEANQQ